jgi:hypothetical protein
VIPEAQGSDYLVEHLKADMAAQGDDVDVNLLRTQANATTLLGSSDAMPTVSDATLRQVAQQASVEVFTLVHPSPANQFTGMHLYLDEAGMLKRLPLNRRASEYARRAGFEPPPTFYGNVYLSRVQRRPKLQHVSLTVGPDTAMDAPWLQAAMTHNLDYQKEQNRLLGKSGEDAQQPAVAGSDGRAQQEAGYAWTQTEEELELIASVPTTTVSKDIKVKFLPQHVQVTMANTPVLAVRLFERVDLDGCTWTLEAGDSADTKTLRLTLEKADAAYWPRIAD